LTMVSQYRAICMSMFLVLQELCLSGAVSQMPEKPRQETTVLILIP
jgi:hypothetical protein